MCMVLMMLMLISCGGSIFLLRIKFIILSVSGKNNTEISLTFKLVDSLLKCLVDALHFEMLFLNIS